MPDLLFDDAEAEQRWRRRFAAVRVSLPDPARDAPDRAVLVSNAGGRFELACWDVRGPGTAGDVRPATDRPDGTTSGTLSADGTTLWWFDDEAGSEFGRWRVQPFGSPPGSDDEPAQLADVPPGYSAGLEVGRSVVLAGFADDDGTRVHLAGPDGGPARLVYRHEADGSVGGLSADETRWVLAHSEHGDSRYPALRVYRTEGEPEVLAELDDTPGRGLTPLEFSPVPGDQRLLVGHERRGRDELLLWDTDTGAVTELAVDLPGDLDAGFSRDGTALIVLHTHAGRTGLFRYVLDGGELAELPVSPGVVSSALGRPDGAIWYRWSDAGTAAQVRTLGPDGRDGVLVSVGPPAPPSRPAVDHWVDGPGGRIHALLGLPEPAPESTESTDSTPPAVFLVHGGPAAADEDSYDAERAVWLDAGFAVVQVNYRGSTGYGSRWRDALTERVGHVELADIAAVHDHLVGTGVIDADRCVLAGASWGGFLTLLGLGTQPERWAVGIAGVPVADYLAAYQDEMEPLRAYDRALFGGSPQEVPEKYRDSSPLTWIDRVTAPVLVLAGEHDPRCPIRQIDSYLDALADRGRRYAQYRYEAGHGSLVVDERLRQVRCEIAFARAELDRSAGR
ncbi:S9 family peptidase [Nakamurella leprariae]|uniref:S9 family peptidase n=1 Tax=Nakamurella leprariae TaxID=2803911 RepID=A0A939C1Q5_9ACTN|nr:S9 family peptidase [Nakamurella leprariae]